MISRRILPAHTSASFAATISMCQFVARAVRGFSSRKQRAAKAARSCRNSAAYSAEERPRTTASSLLRRVADARDQPLDDLAVRRRRDGGGLDDRGGAALDVLQD